MKLSFLLLAVFAFSMSANSYSQTYRLSIDKKNATIAEVFNDIEAKSDFSFLYSPKEIDITQQVSISGKNLLISDILSSMLSGKEIAYRITDKHIILFKADQSVNLTGLSQGIIVNGTVTDDNGPLPGVNITVKGTITGVVTDVNGKYTVTVPGKDAVLVFSFVGYETHEYLVGDQKIIDVALNESTQELDEVVVVGYGTVKKSDLTGAISQIDPTKKQEKLTSNATDLLRNSIAGLYIPFSTSAKGDVDMGNALIRGTTSLKASNKPLIVLDGVIYDGDLANISSADIERIDVMKDASSAAVYGSRSANGVVNITTKKGTKGTPTINLSMNVGLVTPSFIRPVLGPEEYINMRETLLQYTAPRPNQPGYYNNPNNLPDAVTLEQWLAYSNATGDPVDIWLTRLALQDIEIENYKKEKTVDWADLVFQTGLRQDYLASITGGTDKIKYYWSINYSDNEGFIVGERYKSVRSRLNLESKIANFLDVGLNIQYANRDEGSIAANWAIYSKASPYGAAYEEDGSIMYFTHGDPQIINPLVKKTYENWYNKYNDLNTKLYAIITLPLGFSYQFNAINNFTDNRDYDHISSKNPGNSTNGYAHRKHRNTYIWNIENIVKWNKVFDAHSFDLTLLANAEKYQYFSDSQSNTLFSPSDVLGYHNMQAGSAPVISSGDNIWTRDALLARLNYIFTNKYLLTASLRRDGYSAFGQDNPHAFFPSVAVAWRISDESFFNIQKIDQLKIRASWGANGNSAIGAYDALASLSSGKYLYANENGSAYAVSQLIMNKLSNANLKWEKTIAYNVGVDFSLFKYRLNGTLEGYLSTTTDLLVERTLPSVTGIKSIASNLGQVDNVGLELALNSRNIAIPDKFLWQTSFNAAYNKNKIVHLYGDLVSVYDDKGNITSTKESDDYTNQWFIGQSIDAIWDYKPDGVWQEEDAELAYSYGALPGEYRMVDVNGDGVYSDLADKQFLGYSKPQFRWSMMNDFTLFNNISISFSLYGQHGWKINYIEKFGNERESDYVIPYWTPENRSNKWSRISNRDANPKPQSNYINMSFLRLSDISIGYLFPKRIASKLHLKSLKIYGSIQNVAVWSEWPGWDPENRGGPSPRFFNLGINVNL